ncbi:MAG: hypothetical protein K6E53_14180 [Lachnospiraceae bacterium]|jgi:hypothetical protein|nr:hypothetical protein [Lachnospiraceae bacterium]
MDAAVKVKVEKILRGEIRYTSANLAFNMLISKMQKRLKAGSVDMETCMKEMEEFLAKYPIVAKVDLANIAAL